MVKHVWATLRAAEIAEDVLGEDDLQHWGIKGMRWGVRRFQKKDGSLTRIGKLRYQNKDGTLNEAGKKSYDRELKKVREQERIAKNQKATQDKLDKLNDRADKAKNNLDTNNKKSVKDMSDAELKAVVERLRLEQEYTKYITAQKVDAGESWVKKFGKAAWEKAIVPAAQEAGKNIIKNAIENTVKNATKPSGTQQKQQNNNQKK